MVASSSRGFATGSESTPLTRIAAHWEAAMRTERKSPRMVGLYQSVLCSFLRFLTDEGRQGVLGDVTVVNARDVRKESGLLPGEPLAPASRQPTDVADLEIIEQRIVNYHNWTWLKRGFAPMTANRDWCQGDLIGAAFASWELGPGPLRCS